MYFELVLGVLLILNVQAYDKDEDKIKEKELDKPCHGTQAWYPIAGPYDRLKPIKKDPKDDKFYYQGGLYGNPYLPFPYMQGLYTGPYGYDVAPIYHTPLYPGSYNGYIRKENKEYTPVYKS